MNRTLSFPAQMSTGCSLCSCRCWIKPMLIHLGGLEYRSPTDVEDVARDGFMRWGLGSSRLRTMAPARRQRSRRALANERAA
jgi:hypothetical protein